MKVLRYRGETLTLAATVTTAQVLGAPPEMNMVEVEVPSTTKENISLLFCPKLYRVVFYDASAAAGSQYIDLTSNLVDRNTSTSTGTTLDAWATGDALYVGVELVRFRGLNVDAGNLHTGDASVMTGKFWNGSAWTNATISDGTLSGGKTLAQDGLITWTVPTTWVARTLPLDSPKITIPCYWMQFTVSVALDADISLVQLTAMANTTLNSATADAEGIDYVLLQSNAQSLPPYRYYYDPERVGGIEMKSTSITSAANVNWYLCKGGY